MEKPRFGGAFSYSCSGLQQTFSVRTINGKLQAYSRSTRMAVCSRWEPGFDALAWQGIAAPAPKEVDVRLDAELNKIINGDELWPRLTNFGKEPNPLSVDEFASLIKYDVARWTNTAENSGAKVN